MLGFKNSSLSSADTALQVQTLLLYLMTSGLQAECMFNLHSLSSVFDIIVYTSASFLQFLRQFYPQTEPYTPQICCSSQARVCVHVRLRTLGSLSPPSFKTKSSGLLPLVQSANCVRKRESLCDIRAWDRKRAVESLTGLMHISTWSCEKSRKRYRKCLRGCVMLSLITAHVAPPLWMLMWWENSGGFCTFSTHEILYINWKSLEQSCVAAIMQPTGAKYSTENSCKTYSPFRK